MTLLHYLGAALVLLLITVLGWYSGTRVKTAGDFVAGGRSAGAGIVAGSIVGTLVGGSATIGTAQLAFTWGLSAWWFTFGGGIACIILGFVYAKPLRESGVDTMPQLLHREYGQKVATTAALLTSMGNFLSVVAQVLASVALVTSIASMSEPVVIVLTCLLMIAYVVFGGIWGAGIVGTAKTVLLALSVGACGLAALYWQGGWFALVDALPNHYASLIARGAAKDLGVALSMLMGVLTTQAYFQAIISARSLRLAKTGALISAAIIPGIGACGILIGLYMRVHFPDIPSAGALPLFVLEYVPPLFGGMILATLFIACVGTAAGVSLGLGSILCNDIYCVYCDQHPSDKKRLLVSRLILAGILVAASMVSFMNVGSLILNWSILSMALRGVVACGILVFALFLPGRISPACAMTSMLSGLACVIFGKPLVGEFMDPLFLGFAVGVAILFAGYRRAGSGTA